MQNSTVSRAVAVVMLALAAQITSPRLIAQPAAAAANQRAPRAGATPIPVIFVHGNGDHAGLWDNTIWRFESNGYPRERLFAIDLPNPMAASTVSARERNRSTPEDQTAALAAFVTRVLLLDGMISANAAGAPTNLPLARATVTVHEVDAATGERIRSAVHRAETGDDGHWGPFAARATAHYEFEVVAPDSSVMLHVYRSPFPRSTSVMNVRLPAPPARRSDSVSVLITRPRGYLGAGRDTVLFDSAPATGIPPGVPTVDRALRWFEADVPCSVRTTINGETIVVRTHPQDRRRLVLAEFQQE